ncbi:hypothetical protein [Halorarius halobius]|uniref:hypothetical protein n=1 Tax=Halorarius halobius TaxID=2962671 RepID=UPI0020CDFA10|nr:hypothetical protein [Halorarius halobius]
MPPQSRRALLASAAAGIAALAGCSGLRNAVDGAEPTVRPSALREVASSESPTPEPALPVDVVDDLAAHHRERVQHLLERVPRSPSGEETPGETVRDVVARNVESARAELSAAADARYPSERLAALRGARADAAAAAATWAAADPRSDPTPSVAQNAVRDRLAAAERDRRYVGGEDSVGALLAHGTVERRFATAGRWLDGALETNRSGAVGVGEAMESVERARAYLDGGVRLYGGYVTSLPRERDVRPLLATAADDLRSTARERRPDGLTRETTPGAVVDGYADAKGTAVGEALRDCYFDVVDPGAVRTGDDRLAAAALDVQAYLTAVRGFETLESRIESGDYRTVESGEDLRAFRQSAVEAIEAGRSRLDRRLLVESAVQLGFDDERLREFAEGVDGPLPADELVPFAADYLELAVTADAVPAASERVRAALVG